MPTLRAVVSLLILMLPIIAGCTKTTLRIDILAEDLAGRKTALVVSSVQPPFPQAMHDNMLQRTEKALSDNPNLGELISPAQIDSLDTLSPRLRNEYQLYTSTLTESGVSDPELSKKLGKALGVGLLMSVQMFYVPCPVCEFGDQLWLTGQMVDAPSGDVVFRMHIRTNVGNEEGDLKNESDRLVGLYLEKMGNLLEPKWHRLRFRNLKKTQESS